MKRTLIQKDSTRIVKDLIERFSVLSGSGLSHKLTKGELRELFVSRVLRFFLTDQFGIGSGIIINQKGKQSTQTDIVIYDNRVLPPFIKEQNIGVYPAESVVATIEVKSFLETKDIEAAEKSAKDLYTKVYTGDYERLQPLCSVIGFRGNGPLYLRQENKGMSWLNKNINYLIAICHVNKYSWIKFENFEYTGWKFQKFNKNTNEETKRFIAVVLDKVRTASEDRLKYLLEEHRDWLSMYIRDQE